MISAAEQGQADERRASGALSQPRLDRSLPVAVKLGVAFVAIVGPTIIFLALALPPIRTELERAYTSEARAIATTVQAEYALDGSDREGLALFLRGMVSADPSIARVRIYRVVSGVGVVWASSDAAEASDTPTPGDLAPITTGETTQHEEEFGGRRLLETLQPLDFGGVAAASVGVYTSLEPLDAAASEIRQIAWLAAALLVGGLMTIGGLTLYFAVLRPIQRLHRAALRVAAGDLSVRSPDGEELPTRDEIVGVTRAFDHMTRMVAEQRAELERVAMTDGLTGLLNRRSFDRQIAFEVRRADRLGYPLAVLMLDLDGFKRINDTHGHQAGDDALVRAAAALRAAVRDVDVVARYGGDEFTVIQPGSDLEAALVAGTRIRAAIEGLGIVTDPPSGTLLRISVGVAAWRPGQDPGALVAAADAALYRAKARGGGVEVAERASSAA